MFQSGFQDLDQLQSEFQAAFGDSYAMMDPTLVDLVQAAHTSTLSGPDLTNRRDICSGEAFSSAMRLDQIVSALALNTSFATTADHPPLLIADHFLFLRDGSIKAEFKAVEPMPPATAFHTLDIPPILLTVAATRPKRTLPSRSPWSRRPSRPRLCGSHTSKHAPKALFLLAHCSPFYTLCSQRVASPAPADCTIRLPRHRGRRPRGLRGGPASPGELVPEALARGDQLDGRGDRALYRRLPRHAAIPYARLPLEPRHGGRLAGRTRDRVQAHRWVVCHE